MLLFTLMVADILHKLSTPTNNHFNTVKFYNSYFDLLEVYFMKSYVYVVHLFLTLTQECIYVYIYAFH